MRLGAVKVKELILVGYVGKFGNFKSIYFKAFGEKIWAHCQETAEAGRLIAKYKGVCSETAYLIGLIHDIGKIIVFRLMIEAFKFVHPDVEPKSIIFKRLLTEKSVYLSVKIAEVWQLPTVVVNALYDLSEEHIHEASTGQGEVLCQANKANELMLLLKSEMMDINDVLQGLDKCFRDDDLFNLFTKEHAETFEQFKDEQPD